MNRVLRLLAALAALAAALAGVLLLVGGSLGAVTPSRHATWVTAQLAHPPERVWDAIADLPAAVSWRSDLRGIVRLPEREGVPVWREQSRWGELLVEVHDAERPSRLRFVLPPDQSDVSFEGSWLIEITPEANGSRLRITEDARLHGTLLRGLRRLAVGYHGPLETFVHDLARHLDGPQASPPAVQRGEVLHAE